MAVITGCVNEQTERTTILSKSRVNGTQYIYSSWAEGGFCLINSIFLLQIDQEIETAIVPELALL